MSKLELRLPPIVFVFLLVSAMWLIAQQLVQFNYAFPGAVIYGSIVMVLGVLIAFTGILEFRHAKTTVDPTKPDVASSLVKSGIYRFTRNPMYIGALFALSGWAILLGNSLNLLLLPFYVFYITRFQIIPEERALLKNFPDEFPQYQNSVRRWI